MPDFTKPLFARGNQMITLIAEAKAAGFMCAKLEVLGGAKYRCYFIKDFSCVSQDAPIQLSRDEDKDLHLPQVQDAVDSTQNQPQAVSDVQMPEMEKVKSCPTTKSL